MSTTLSTDDSEHSSVTTDKIIRPTDIDGNPITFSNPAYIDGALYEAGLFY